MKYSSTNSPKTVSTPQIAKEKIIENTRTKTDNLCASANEGQVTWFFNSSYDCDI